MNARLTARQIARTIALTCGPADRKHAEQILARYGSGSGHERRRVLALLPVPLRRALDRTPNAPQTPRERPDRPGVRP